jgi:hypothetical protein
MNEKSETVKLADVLEQGNYNHYDVMKAAAELRRLSAENQVLQSALDAVLDFAGTIGGGSSWWEDVWSEHQAAIDKVEKQP